MNWGLRNRLVVFFIVEKLLYLEADNKRYK